MLAEPTSRRATIINAVVTVLVSYFPGRSIRSRRLQTDHA
jgi:hypothetical protein